MNRIFWLLFYLFISTQMVNCDSKQVGPFEKTTKFSLIEPGYWIISSFGYKQIVEINYHEKFLPREGWFVTKTHYICSDGRWRFPVKNLDIPQRINKNTTTLIQKIKDPNAIDRCSCKMKKDPLPTSKPSNLLEDEQ